MQCTFVQISRQILSHSVVESLFFINLRLIILLLQLRRKNRPFNNRARLISMRETGIINSRFFLTVNFFQMTFTDENFLSNHHHIRIKLLKAVKGTVFFRLVILHVLHVVHLLV